MLKNIDEIIHYFDRYIQSEKYFFCKKISIKTYSLENQIENIYYEVPLFNFNGTAYSLNIFDVNDLYKYAKYVIEVLFEFFDFEEKGKMLFISSLPSKNKITEE